MRNNIFFPNLDGLRFLAFLAVFFAHSFYTEIPSIQESTTYHWVITISDYGIYGVNFFFVLSGFLITHLLITEKKEYNKIHVGFFYMRRILRIWPLFYFVVFIGFFIIPRVMNLIGENYVEQANLWSYIFFINNFDQAPSTAVLGVLWSVAIEEQFYLVWPILIALCPIKRLPWLLAVLIAVSFIHTTYQPFNLSHTLYNISDLSIGATLAYLLCEQKKQLSQLASIGKIPLAVVMVLGLSTIAIYPHIQLPFLRAFIHLLIGIFFAWIILDQNEGAHSIFKLSKSSFMTYWGKRTYGLYMLHFMVIYAVGKVLRTHYTSSLFDVLIVETCITFILSLLAAWCSYQFFEKPILKLKERFQVKEE